MYLKEWLARILKSVTFQANSFVTIERRAARSGSSPSQLIFDDPRLQGVLLVAACAVVYFALRPPLFDFDGYMYRLYALLPSRFYNINPQHLLWDPVQILLVSVARLVGRPTTVPFQIFGILVNCTTLFALYLLLSDTNTVPFFAAAAVVFVAFSPAFWYLGFQNHPYTVAFLAVVLHLHCWRTEGAATPWRSRLLAAVALTTAILFHQAVILLVPVAVVVLILSGHGTLGRRLVAGFAWGAGVTAVVTGAYFCFWTYVSPGEGLLRWSTGYMESVHRLQLFQLGLPKSFARSVMGLSSALVQDAKIEAFIEREIRPKTVFTIYIGLGLAALAGLGMAFLRTGPRRTLLALSRNNSLFAVSFLSIIAWWTFAFSWEAATAHYWVLGLFPAMVCLGLLLRESRAPAKYMTLTVMVLVSAWNVYFNVGWDRSLSRNFPDPLVASVERYVRSLDIFIFLGNDEWFGDINYILLFNCLRLSGKVRGVAIFNDYIEPVGTRSSWTTRLREKIESTLDSGGQVFVAAHVFDHKSYRDLSLTDHPFNEQIDTEYLGIDGPALEQEIRQIFANYRLERSSFQLGSDFYLTVRRR